MTTAIAQRIIASQIRHGVRNTAGRKIVKAPAYGADSNAWRRAAMEAVQARRPLSVLATRMLHTRWDTRAVARLV